jgi:hypothetical protein
MNRPHTSEPTRYEITAETMHSEPVLIGYSAPTTRTALLSFMQQHGQRLIDLCAISETDQLTFVRQPRWHALCAGWRIGFTGRTQRDACTLGEHIYISDVTIAQGGGQ